ncbi:hypothetical protein C4K04_3417 [Pseudomonas chlororaphis]|uniref:DUF2933 domain-containing protein n=1 Tax=Pseudomonas chlororaphis TaxID=587753 RepID=A0A3G7TS34_9PSED|nr:DUF2933 domain-containing protein [Pseudomonas chlororaphis]AZE49089.1 hypothetical protein C4K04_3417 [Pseudomonas chlororaphis]
MNHEFPQHRARRTHWYFLGFLAIAGYFLFTEHRAHVVPYLPFLLLLACPLMHLFMHRGHGGHESSESGEHDGCCGHQRTRERNDVAHEQETDKTKGPDRPV